jgi:hypothetical protein
MKVGEVPLYRLPLSTLNDSEHIHSAFVTHQAFRLENQFQPEHVRAAVESAKRQFSPSDPTNREWALHYSERSSYTPRMSLSRDDDVLHSLFFQLSVIAQQTIVLLLPHIHRTIECGVRGLRCLRYQDVTSSGYISSFALPHVHLLTIFLGGTGYGLQGFIEGEWCSILNPLGDVVVATGSLLSMYHASYKGFEYRLVASPEEQYCLIGYLEPDPDSLLPNGHIVREWKGRQRRFA